jgi:hypothetical protein
LSGGVVADPCVIVVFHPHVTCSFAVRLCRVVVLVSGGVVADSVVMVIVTVFFFIVAIMGVSVSALLSDWLDIHSG